jgi:predicted enzyme related to lactoylglutathione lyase
MSYSAGARLSRAILLVRGNEGLCKAVQFYHEAVGLPVLRVTDTWAELMAGPHITLTLKAVDSNEAQNSIGYSPWLHFEVADLDPVIAKCVQAGAHLDGPIQYPAHGKVAVLRSPDHHMIALYEPSSPSSTMMSNIILPQEEPNDDDENDE